MERWSDEQYRIFGIDPAHTSPTYATFWRHSTPTIVNGWNRPSPRPSSTIPATTSNAASFVRVESCATFTVVESYAGNPKDHRSA